MKSSERYQVGDIVMIKDPDMIISSGDLEKNFSDWINVHGKESFRINRILEEVASSKVKHQYYVTRLVGDYGDSPDFFYHEELALIKTNNGWDE